MTKLLKPKEVAEILRIDLSSVYALARDGKLASYRIGSSVRFSEEDLEEYLETRKCGLKFRSQIIN